MMLEKVSFSCANLTVMRVRNSYMFLTTANIKCGEGGKVLLCIHGGKSPIEV